MAKLKDAKERFSEEVDIAANEVAAATLRECKPASDHEAIVAGFKAGVTYMFARIINDERRKATGRASEVDDG